MANKKPTYLLTPRGEEYLDKLLIINVKDTHEVDEVAPVSTKTLMLQGDEGVSLF